MIKHYPFEQLGSAEYDWLKTRHHFSFASYFNPKRMGFGTLRVINDDIIQPHTGFGEHPHQDMEIITYVRSGAISHEDSEGNKGRTVAGDVQVMTAGTGIRHAEYNHEDEVTTIYQIWIEPREKNLKPTWAAHQFPKEYVKNSLELLVSGDNSAPLYINQDAKLYVGRIAKNSSIQHHLSKQAYILVTEGKVEVDSVILKQGDGAEVTEQECLTITAIEESEILVIEVAA